MQVGSYKNVKNIQTFSRIQIAYKGPGKWNARLMSITCVYVNFGHQRKCQEEYSREVKM